MDIDSNTQAQGGLLTNEALRYARMGFPVFPCQSGGKTPATPNGVKDATTDEQAIRQWWTKNPRYNVAIATSSLLVVDLDDPCHEWAIRDEWPAGTPIAETPSGGFHIVFRKPQGIEVRNWTKFHGNADTRTDGGYVVVAPSTVGVKSYQWLAPLCHRDDLSEAPDYVLRAIRGYLTRGKPQREPTGQVPSIPPLVSVRNNAYAHVAMAEEIKAISAAPEGTRNATLNKAAFALAQLVASGALDEGHVRQALEVAALSAGLGEDEARRTIESGFRSGAKQPRDLGHVGSNGHAGHGGVDLSRIMSSASRETSPPSGTPIHTVDDLPAEQQVYEPFPVDELPRVLRDFVVAVSNSMRCDPAFVVLPALAALGAAIGNTRRLMIKRRWYEPPILWTCVVADSGVKKTPPYKEVLRRIRDREKQAQRDYQAAAMEYAREHKAWERDHAAWKKANDGSEPPEEPVKPIWLRFTVSDTTMEALAPILLENPRGVLLARDELRGWMGSFDRYTKGGAGADCSNWLSMYSVEPIIIDRKTGEPRTIYVHSPAVCVTGGIQPDILRRALTAEYFENGLAARLLMACPPRRKNVWTEEEIDEDTERKFGQLFDQLWALQPGTDAQGEPEPALLRLTEDAKAAFIEYYGEHADEQVDLDGALSAAWSKLEAAAARIALVLHFVRWASGEHSNMGFVDVDTMSAAIAITKWFKSETRRIYDMLAESEGDRDTRRLTEWLIKRGGTATVRDVQRGCRYLSEPGKAEEALQRLV